MWLSVPATQKLSRVYANIQQASVSTLSDSLSAVTFPNNFFHDIPKSGCHLLRLETLTTYNSQHGVLREAFASL